MLHTARDDLTQSVAGERRQVYRDSSLADPSKPVMSATGPWTPAAQLSTGQANALVERSLPPGVRRVGSDSADRLNREVLRQDPTFATPYVPGSRAMLIETREPIQFVRYYVQDPNSSKQIGTWMMRSDDAVGLSPEQVASKFALPQVPTHIVDVTVPPGHQLRATVANDVNIFPDRSLGGNGGGGGVQFELLTKPENPNQFKTWFSNERRLK